MGKYSRESIESNITSIDRQLLLMIYDELCETNRLLRLTSNENKQGNAIIPVDHKCAENGDIDALKRQQLMQLMAKLPNKPKGWNTWGVEELRKHLKGAS